MDNITDANKIEVGQQVFVGESRGWDGLTLNPAEVVGKTATTVTVEVTYPSGMKRKKSYGIEKDFGAGSRWLKSQERKTTSNPYPGTSYLYTEADGTAFLARRQLQEEQKAAEAQVRDAARAFERTATPEAIATLRAALDAVEVAMQKVGVAS